MSVSGGNPPMRTAPATRPNQTGALGYLSCRASLGFTLLEVLIALVILAIALGAVIKVSGQSAQMLQRLRADTAATVIAQDLCARLQLAATAPAVGTQSSRIQIDGQSWRVRQSVSAGLLPGVLKIEYAVQTPDPFEGQASMVTYFYARSQIASPPVNPVAKTTTPGATSNQTRVTTAHRPSP